MITIAGGKGNDYEVIRGIYVHPKLIPHVASWVSDEYLCICRWDVIRIYQNKLFQYHSKAEHEAREALRTWLKSSSLLLNIKQQQLEAIENELEVKTMLADTMQQGSVDARQQKQFLEGIVYQADGVIGEMGGMLEQKGWIYCEAK